MRTRVWVPVRIFRFLESLQSKRFLPIARMRPGKLTHCQARVSYCMAIKPWYRWPDSDRRPAASRAAALSIELQRHRIPGIAAGRRNHKLPWQAFAPSSAGSVWPRKDVLWRTIHHAQPESVLPVALSDGINISCHLLTWTDILPKSAFILKEIPLFPACILSMPKGSPGIRAHHAPSFARSGTESQSIRRTPVGSSPIFHAILESSFRFFLFHRLKITRRIIRTMQKITINETQPFKLIVNFSLFLS